MRGDSRKGQVWIETVIYTLIAFVLIGVVLSFAKPKIEEMQDKAIFEKMLGTMQSIDETIFEIISGGPGNKRSPTIKIDKGRIIIDKNGEKISYEMEGKYIASELDKDVVVGSFILRTEEIGGVKKITLSKDYDEKYDFDFSGNSNTMTITASSNGYTLSITNKGGEDKPKIEFDLS